MKKIALLCLLTLAPLSHVWANTPDLGKCEEYLSHDNDGKLLTGFPPSGERQFPNGANPINKGPRSVVAVTTNTVYIYYMINQHAPARFDDPTIYPNDQLWACTKANGTMTDLTYSNAPPKGIVDCSYLQGALAKENGARLYDSCGE